MRNQNDKHHCDTTFIQWRKSSYSNPNGNECIEISSNDNTVGMRDSHNPDSTMLVVDRSEWMNFLNGITAGEFHPTVMDRQHRSSQPVGLSPPLR